MKGKKSSISEGIAKASLSNRLDKIKTTKSSDKGSDWLKSATTRDVKKIDETKSADKQELKGTKSAETSSDELQSVKDAIKKVKKTIKKRKGN